MEQKNNLLFSLTATEEEFILKDNFKNEEYKLKIKEPTNESFEYFFENLIELVISNFKNEEYSLDKLAIENNFGKEKEGSSKPLHVEMLYAFKEMLESEIQLILNDLKNIDSKTKI